MVLSSETYPGGYEHQSYWYNDFKQQSYSHNDYPSTYVRYGQDKHMEPIPPLYDANYRPRLWLEHAYDAAPHMEPIPSHMMQHCSQPGWNNTSTEYYSHSSNGHVPLHFSGFPTSGHRTPVGGYESSFQGATHGPMGAKVETKKHECTGYVNRRPSMYNNPMHGGHHTAEWKLKSIEDDG